MARAFSVGILYHSVTGGTKFIADSVAEAIKGANLDGCTVTMVDIGQENKRRLSSPSYAFPGFDMYIVGTWADAMMASRFVRDYLGALAENGPSLAGKPVAAFCSCAGGAGTVTRWILHCFASKDAIPVAEHKATFITAFPDDCCTITAAGAPPVSRSQVEGVRKWAAKMGAIVASCSAGTVTPMKLPAGFKSREIPEDNYGYTPESMREIAFGGYPRADPDKCVRCLGCVNACPYNCWSLDASTDRIVFGNREDCYSCLACVRACPQHAISGPAGKGADLPTYYFDPKHVTK